VADDRQTVSPGFGEVDIAEQTLVRPVVAGEARDMARAAGVRGCVVVVRSRTGGLAHAQAVDPRGSAICAVRSRRA
jgi:hypothetical protein